MLSRYDHESLGWQRSRQCSSPVHMRSIHQEIWQEAFSVSCVGALGFVLSRTRQGSASTPSPPLCPFLQPRPLSIREDELGSKPWCPLQEMKHRPRLSCLRPQASVCGRKKHWPTSSPSQPCRLWSPLEESAPCCPCFRYPDLEWP